MCIVLVPGVLQESQQWEVYPEGPAGCPDAESPEVSSASSGTDGEWLHGFKVSSNKLRERSVVQRKHGDSDEMTEPDSWSDVLHASNGFSLQLSWNIQGLQSYFRTP